MATLLEDIHSQSAWLVKAFKADGLTLNYSIDSFKELDRFYDLHVKEGEAVAGGRFSQHRGAIMFAIGSYMGETFIKSISGAKWQTDDADPEGEVNATVVFPDGGQVWPMQKAIKRFQSEADGLYAYGRIATHDQVVESVVKKPWWKFW